ncbi:MAG TPA: ABC transporter ATP-binding protein [Lachnospiraceae bacterium]|nr:ABC transporter ATP-binding protein [Lachnospiraceae bacterium]
MRDRESWRGLKRGVWQLDRKEKRRRSGVLIMGQLIGLVRPLLHIMILAVVLGVLGYLCAVFLTILAGQVILKGLSADMTLFYGLSATEIFMIIGVIAVLRGVLHYMEQYCNHFIAFKLLAIIRHKVFAALRKLCPAKLEGREKGNLISIITTDIELLEVFYAHTISPIAIAVLTSLVMVFFMGQYHVCAAVLAVAAYLIVGAVIPVWNGHRGSEKGMAFRTEFGELNSFVLSSLRGLDETIQYGGGQDRRAAMEKKSEELGKLQKELSKQEGGQRSVTNFLILLSSFAMLLLTEYLQGRGEIGFDGVITCTVAMMGSFGPVVALASLSNNLNQTLASGERVLSILEEEPVVKENPGESKPSASTGANVEDVTFAYGRDVILKKYNLQADKGQIVGIHGASGSGKSTVLKLLMRFWDVTSGKVEVSGENVQTMATKKLREYESFVTQDTDMFHDSIAANIAIGKPDATREEIIRAAKNASLHDFVMSLPEGYDTEVGELGDTLSGGERQRIGIARAFLHDAPLLLLDEPTSNLDSLNEGVILKALQENCREKTVILVSHRKSTMSLADVVFEMEKGRNS